MESKMSRSIFGGGSNLPPGVTNRMIEEQFGSSESEALTDLFYDKMTEAARETVGRGNIGLDEVALEKLASWFIDHTSNTIHAARKDQMADDAMANESIGVTQLLQDLAKFPVPADEENSDDDTPLCGAAEWHLTLGHVRAARRSQPDRQGPDGELS